MILRDVMDKGTETVEFDRSTAEAANLMREGRTKCIVVTRQQEIIGTITGYDLAIGCLVEGHRPWECLVFRHMTFPAITANPDLDVSEAIVLMKSNDVDHLPVVDGGRLLGVVSYGSMVTYLDPSQLMLPASSAA
jgi:CBS domain-containing protein